MIPEKLVKENGDLLKKMLWSLTKEDILQKQRSLAVVRKTMLYSKPLMMGGGGGGGGGGNSVKSKSKKRKQDGDKEGDKESREEEENVREELVGDAFEMILRALREKAKAMRYVSSRHGPGHWL